MYIYITLFQNEYIYIHIDTHTHTHTHARTHARTHTRTHNLPKCKSYQEGIGGTGNNWKGTFSIYLTTHRHIYTQTSSTEIFKLPQNCLAKNEHYSQKLFYDCLFFNFIFRHCFASVFLRDDVALQLLSVRIHVRLPFDFIVTFRYS